MSVDIWGTSWDQCRSMVQYSFTTIETRRLVRTDSPGRPPRLSHSSWTMSCELCLNDVFSSLYTQFLLLCCNQTQLELNCQARWNLVLFVGECFASFKFFFIRVFIPILQVRRRRRKGMSVCWSGGCLVHTHPFTALVPWRVCVCVWNLRQIINNN